MSEVQKPTIAELFERDPLQLTKPDIDEIIKYYIARRHQYNLGQIDAGAAKKLNIPISINLDEFGL